MIRIVALLLFTMSSLLQAQEKLIWSATPFTLQSGDEVHIHRQRLGYSVADVVLRLDANGIILIPFAGSINLSGLSENEATRKLLNISFKNSFLKGSEFRFFNSPFPAQ